jgi:hypothetical protein
MDIDANAKRMSAYDDENLLSISFSIDSCIAESSEEE